jgi:hypothetical protein
VMVAVRMLLPAGPERLFVGVFLGLAAAAAVGVATVGPARLRELARIRSPRLPSAERRPNYTAVLADTTPEGVT